MFFHYIKIAFTNIWNNKKFSSINILGFAFSMSVCIAIILFLQHEYSYDRYHKNEPYIYRLVDSENNSSMIDYRVKDQLIENYAEVKNVCLFQLLNMQVSVTYDHAGFYVDNLLSVDNAFFDIFSLEFIEGNPNNAFPNLHSVVITESSARNIFGNNNPIGKEFVFRNQFPLIVSAVIQDFPDNSSFDAGMIVNAENDDFKFSSWIGDSRDKSTYRWPFNIYLQLEETTDPSLVVGTISTNINRLKPYVNQISLMPLKEIYLHDSTWGSETKRGNSSLLHLLLSISVIILMLAVINYINLTLARQNQRNKEVGIRKTIGASRKDLIIQLLFESLLVTFISFFFSLLLFEFCSPFYTSIFGVSISSSQLLEFPNNIILIVSVTLIGILSGLWPSIFFTSFNPIRIINRKTSIFGRRNYSRQILTVFQFTVSIILIFCLLVIWKQIKYVNHKDLGLNRDYLLNIDLPRITHDDRSNISGFINSLKEYTYIKEVTATGGLPGDIRVYMGSGIEGKDKSIACLYADASFINAYEITLLQGRNFLPGDIGKACLINESAYEFFGWNDLDNKRYNNGREGGYEVVGVVKNFHFKSLHESIQPMCILSDPNFITHVTVKVDGNNISELIAYIRNSWKVTLVDYPLSYRFYDDWLNTIYQKEEKLGRVIGFFAILAIGISCLGILGLAIFTSERRTKEIGIRKVNGASLKNIFFMLTKDFTKWVIIAFIVGSPIAYVMINNWLQNFAYKTDISWWIFGLSGFSSIIIALLTVGWQTMKVTRINPVEALKYE